MGERDQEHTQQGASVCKGRGSQKIGTRPDRNAEEKVENDAWKRAGGGGGLCLAHWFGKF